METDEAAHRNAHVMDADLSCGAPFGKEASIPPSGLESPGHSGDRERQVSESGRSTIWVEWGAEERLMFYWLLALGDQVERGPHSLRVLTPLSLSSPDHSSNLKTCLISSCPFDVSTWIGLNISPSSS